MTKRPFLLGILITLGTLVILYCNFKSNNTAKNYLQAGGFHRSESDVISSLRDKFSLSDGYYDIVGIIKNKIIIREVKTPNIILLNEDKTTTTILLPENIDPKSIFDIAVDPLHDNILEIHCNNNRNVHLYDIKKDTIIKSFKFKQYFDKIIRCSQNTFYAFIPDNRSRNLVLAVIEFDEYGNDHIIETTNIVRESMVDDGMFQKYGSDLVYINYYNNKISVLDSSLTHEKYYHTIDTITSKPKTVTIKNGSIRKFLNAPRYVNQLSQISDGLLFVNSYVKSENYLSKDIDVIDIYDIKNKFSYKGSLFLKRIDNNRISDFLVSNKKLILQYPTTTVIYELSMQI